MQIALLVDTSQAAARRHLAHAAGAAAVRHRADQPERERQEERGRASSPSANGRRSSPTTRPTWPRLKKGINRIWSTPETRRVPAGRRRSRSRQGFKKREAQRPGDRRDLAEGAGAELQAATTRCSSRCATAAPRLYVAHARSAHIRPQRRGSQPQHRSRIKAPRAPAAAATSC